MYSLRRRRRRLVNERINGSALKSCQAEATEKSCALAVQQTEVCRVIDGRPIVSGGELSQTRR